MCPTPAEAAAESEREENLEIGAVRSSIQQRHEDGD